MAGYLSKKAPEVPRIGSTISKVLRLRKFVDTDSCNTAEAPIWPPPFGLDGPQFPSTFSWDHQRYRDPNDQPVKVMYSRTKMESEKIAREFLRESVLGFDMEWPPESKPGRGRHVRLQKRIGLIQIASVDKIALFHLGQHAGNHPDELLAPSLRKLIESPDISKVGVAVLCADFFRLRRYFGLQPRGAFELSHLHSLVTSKNPAEANVILRSLATQVQEHLGLPLDKGKVRVSNWSGPLEEEQISYAAADAYVGLMLYHCMNAKRAAMKPVPPLPVHAEFYTSLEKGVGSRGLLRLGTAEQHVCVDDFFRPQANVQKPSPDLAPNVGLGPEAKKILFNRLNARRKRVASEKNRPAYKIARSALLRAISRRCPRTHQELIHIKGFSNKARRHGKMWLDIVKSFLAERAPTSPEQVVEPDEPDQPSPAQRRGGKPSREDMNAPPFLDTGLSLSMVTASIEPGNYSVDDADAGHKTENGASSDQSSAFDSLLRSSYPKSLKRKRTMLESSVSENGPRPSAPDRAAVKKKAPPRVTLWEQAALVLFEMKLPKRTKQLPKKFGPETKLDP